MVELIGDERLDHLLAEKLRIIQSPSVFSFSLDAVLLSKFVNIPIQKGRIADLCSGNGVIPLLLAQEQKGRSSGWKFRNDYLTWQSAVLNITVFLSRFRWYMVT